MRQSILGIYLNHFSYSESSVILKVYTEKDGLQSFVVKGMKKKKGGAALLQPFHLLEIGCNFNPSKELNYANTVKLSHPTVSITMDIRKSSIAIFLTEVLYRSIKEEESNSEFYNFLSTSIALFDQSEFNPNYHLIFLMEASRYFGFQPSLPNLKSQKYFNLKEGVFEYPEILNDFHLSEELSNELEQLIGVKFEHIQTLNYNAASRRKLLAALISYYELQLDIKKGAITSHKIFEVVFE